jgi:hypothetical protein
MQVLESIYKDVFFRNRYKLHWRAPHVCGAIKEVFDPLTVIDVGCATGDLVEEFNKMGILSMGLEGAETVKPHLIIPDNALVIWDLREVLDLSIFNPLNMPYPFGLTICLEVAEHIEPEYAHIFVGNLTLLSKRILLSAAPPGQGGHHHVNCQQPNYWDKMFGDYDYIRKQEMADKVIELLKPWKHKPGIKAYYYNLLYYEKESNEY